MTGMTDPVASPASNRGRVVLASLGSSVACGVCVPSTHLRPAVVSLFLAFLLSTASCSEKPTEAQPPSATHPLGEVLDSVPVTARPFGLAVSSAGVVYVARLDADSLGRADLPSRVFSAAAKVGRTPSHVTFNPAGTTAYSSNQGDQDISVVNVATNIQATTIPVSSDAWNVIVSPDGTRLWATTDHGALFVVNTASNSIVTSLTLLAGDALRGLAMDRTGHWLYVGGTLSGNIYVIDAIAHTLARTLAVGGRPQHLAVSQDGSELYVANETRGLDIVTLATGAVRTITLFAGGYGLALSPDDVQLYVTIPSVGLVQVVDRATGDVQRTLAVGGKPRGVAFTHSGANAVIANEAGWVTFVR